MEERRFPQEDSPRMRGQAAVDTERDLLALKLQTARGVLVKRVLKFAVALGLFSAVRFQTLWPRLSSQMHGFYALTIFICVLGGFSIIQQLRATFKARKMLEVWTQTFHDLPKQLDACDDDRGALTHPSRESSLS
jgi:hypothetical protein